MLFEDRNHLLDQSLEFLIARILFILLELADQLVVIRAGFLQEEPIEFGTLRSFHFPFEFLLACGLMSNGLMRLGAIFQISPALLRHINYHPIDIGMILDQLICVRANLAV